MAKLSFRDFFDIGALTCNDVRVSIFVRVVWMLRILGRVFVETTVGSDLLVLLAEADVLKRKEKTVSIGCNWIVAAYFQS